jgi:type IV pilus assembly protein PilM
VDEKSVWKKEISFRRKPKEKDLPPEPGSEPTSVWKKEISFKRKPKEAAPPVVAASVDETESKQSIWKREIKLARKAKVEPLAAEAKPEPVAPDPAPVVEPEPEPEPIAVPEAETLPEFPAAVEEVEPESWEAEPALPPAPFVEPAVAEAPRVEVVPEPAAVVAEPELEPQVVHPPVPAAELPPLDEPEKSAPFWKREIAIGRRGPSTPKAERPRKRKRVKAERLKPEKQPKQPKPKRVKGEKRVKTPKVKVDRGGGGKKVIGLKIGASQLAAARVTNNGTAELLQVAREPLGAGIVVGGELRDPDLLAAALKDFFAKHKLPKRGVRLGIANNRIGVRTFEVVGITDQKQLDNAIRFRAQETLPIPIDEAVLDYHVLGESTNEEGQQVRRVLLVVAYREQIDRYMDACKKAGIGLAGIDLEAFALLRALQAPQAGAGDDPDAALVAVAIGHERSTFAVSDGRVCEFTRVLEWGGSALNVAIARALDAAPSEVEATKRELSLADESVPEGLTDEQATKAREAARRAIQTFARELVSSLQYYQNQPGSLGIGEIVLTGGTAHLPGLAAELERLIGVRVRIGDPLARIRVSKKVGNPDQLGSFAVAIGLGIED